MIRVLLRVLGSIAYILGGLIFYRMFLRVLRGWGHIPGTRRSQRSQPGPAHAKDTLVADPQCGAYIPRSTAFKVRDRVGGKTYYFCSRSCLEGYRSNVESANQKGSA